MKNNKSNLIRIGEFAKLVGCSIVSLRYYEKIGALRPTYVDPQTGYRYYSLQQIYHVRLIRICIDAGISPKNLRAFFSDADLLQINSLFASFSAIAEARLLKAQSDKCLAEAMAVEHRRQMAVAPLKPRWIHARPMVLLEISTGRRCDQPIDFELYLETINELVRTINRLGITPLAQQGLSRGNDGTWHAYLAVLREDDLLGKVLSDRRLIIRRIAHEPFLTKAIYGESLDKCFTNVFSEIDAASIDFITEMWMFTMVTDIAALEITYLGIEPPSDLDQILEVDD